MKTILITAIGGDIAQGVATVLREAYGDYRLVGTDIHEEHGGTLYVDAFHVVPRATELGYVSALLAVIGKESVDIVMPMSEVELGIWADPGKRKSGEWLIPGEEVVTTGLDKLTTARRLEHVGVEVPWTVDVRQSAPLSVPCIMKSRTGSGSRKVFMINDHEDAEYFSPRFPDSIYQELLLPADREVTVAVYRTRDDRVGVFQMRRRLTGGLTGWVEVIEDPRITQMCETVAHGLELQGSMNVQLRITEDGPRVFEINPRFSSTTLIRHRLGFRDVVWSLEELDGAEIVFPETPVGKMAVRTNGASVIG